MFCIEVASATKDVAGIRVFVFVYVCVLSKLQPEISAERAADKKI